jgi:hypothetical protein
MNDLPMAEGHCRAARGILEKIDSPLLRYQAEFLMGEIERASSRPDFWLWRLGAVATGQTRAFFPTWWGRRDDHEKSQASLSKGRERLRVGHP